VVVGGIIPPADAEILRAKGVAAIYTPRDFQLAQIVGDLLTMVEQGRGAESGWARQAT